MTRQIHDQFAKEYLEELLAPLGTIKKSKKVKSEVQEIDVWFEPASSPSRTELPLGLLGKMAATSCLFEPFRNPPSEIAAIPNSECSKEYRIQNAFAL